MMFRMGVAVNQLAPSQFGSKLQSSLRNFKLTFALAGSLSLMIAAPYTGNLAYAQTPPTGRQIGTVKEVTPNKLTIATDAGQSISVSVVDGAKVLQLSPGSTDLKLAQTIALNDIETGDRVLVTGHQDAPDAMTVSRVILMKSTDIAQKNETAQDDWQKRGMNGLVSALDPASGVITISMRGRKVAVQTQPTTVYRRYANGSVAFTDAVVGTMDQIRVGDQLRVRGEKAQDGESIKAEEIVTGAFENLAGTITSIDSASQTFTLTDTANKKLYVVKVTANSSVRALPVEAATRFAARARGSESPASAQTARATDKVKPNPSQSAATGDASSGQHPGMNGGASGSAGMDLSQLVNRLPQGSFNDLHKGEAVMVVTEKSAASGDPVTAITILSGVEPILSATPKGAASMTLSPWNVGGGSPESGGGS